MLSVLLLRVKQWELFLLLQGLCRHNRTRYFPTFRHTVISSTQLKISLLLLLLPPPQEIGVVRAWGSCAPHWGMEICSLSACRWARARIPIASRAYSSTYRTILPQLRIVSGLKLRREAMRDLMIMVTLMVIRSKLFIGNRSTRSGRGPLSTEVLRG